MRPLALGLGVWLLALAAYTVSNPRWWARSRDTADEFERTTMFIEEQQRWWGHVFAYLSWWAGLFFVVVGFAP